MLFPEIEFSHNHLILNSTSNFSKAEQYFKQHELLFIYPDLDDSGFAVVKKIEKMGLNFRDESAFYRNLNNVNDLNDFLRHENSQKNRNIE
jgi:hypothetical protein